VIQLLTLTLLPEEAEDINAIRKAILIKTGHEFKHIRWKKRSIDARSRQIKINASFECSEQPLPNRVQYT